MNSENLERVCNVEQDRNVNNRRFIINNEVCGSVPLEILVKVVSYFFLVFSFVILIVSLTFLFSDIEVFVTLAHTRSIEILWAKLKSKNKKLCGNASHNDGNEYYRITRTVPARKSILIRLLYHAALIECFTSLYLSISCRYKYSVGILVWLLLTFFIFCNNILFQWLILSEASGPVIAFSFFHDGIVMWMWFLVYSYYVQYFLIVENNEPEYAVLQTERSNGRLSQFVNNCVCVLRNCTLRSLQIRSALYVAFVTFVSWIVSIVFICLFHEIPSYDVVFGSITYLYAISSTFALIGICKKYGTFVKLWLYFTASLIIALIVLTVFVANIMDVRLAFTLIGMNMFTFLASYCWLTVYSFYVRSWPNIIDADGAESNLPPVPSCPVRRDVCDNIYN